MRSYIFIRDPEFSALRRISPGEVPALFCIREVDLPAPPSRRARLLAQITQVATRAAVFGAALARDVPRRRPVDPVAVPR